jgi:hypothetical protein
MATNLNHFALAYPEHSSFGPTADGRCKPDIVAVGNCLAADDSEPNRYEATGSWSSFSTPIVTGTISLLVQKAKAEPRLSIAVSPRGGNCVMKAILMNSATKLPYWHKGQLHREDDHAAPLDHIQGAGMLNAADAYKHLTAGPGRPGEVPATGWDNHVLNTSKSPENVYKIAIAEPAGKIIAATLVWNKHYRSSYPFEHRPEKNTNLRLELWAMDPNNSKNDYLLDYSDSSVDNVEHIYCRADANYTNYEIVLSLSDTNSTSTTERYGLSWNVSSDKTYDEISLYDLNADGVVNDLDFSTLLYSWITHKEPGGYFLGDVNTDGVFDANDLQSFLEHTDLKADWRAE